MLGGLRHTPVGLQDWPMRAQNGGELCEQDEERGGGDGRGGGTGRRVGNGELLVLFRAAEVFPPVGRL